MKSMLRSTNPGKNFLPLGEVAITSFSEIRSIVSGAREAFPNWRALGVSGRIAHLERLYTIFQAESESLSMAMCREMGMAISGARSSTRWALGHFRWDLDNAERCLAPTVTHEDAEQVHSQVLEPYGVMAVISPWNFPISNFVMGALQPLLAGNTVVYKLSEEVPLFGQLLDTLVSRASLPAGVFNQVYGAGDVGEQLVKEDINALFFTGSSAVGRKLYKICGEKFIPCVLELGGSDAGIVFADADIDANIENIFWSKFVNNGQICCGLKRLLVEDAIHDEVVEKLRASIAAKLVGDPEDENTTLGSLAAKRQCELLAEQVLDAERNGAVAIRCKKVDPEVLGAYFPPTLLTNVKPGMRAWTEELFGPVLTVIPFQNEAEAVELANATPYGLSGYVFTKDRRRFERVAAAIETGSISLNGCDYSGPANPFGGFKSSGFGKTGGALGFVNASRVKVVSKWR